MEPHRLVLGIPEIPGKSFEVSRYRPDGNWQTLMRMDQAGAHLEVNGGLSTKAYLGGSGSTGTGVYLGSLNPNVTLVQVYNKGSQRYMSVAARQFSTVGGADIAEPFHISVDKSSQELEPGSVVVIDESNPGHLKRSEQAYDTRVAGIISGAGGVNSGIILQQEGVLEGGQNVALTGRVYVRADASNGPIKPGDLLTTSTKPGYAMRVTNHDRAHGAVLGKAMTELKEGEGQVLVLVTLH
jgi:hypothetical protein